MAPAAPEPTPALTPTPAQPEGPSQEASVPIPSSPTAPTAPLRESEIPHASTKSAPNAPRRESTGPGDWVVIPNVRMRRTDDDNPEQNATQAVSAVDLAAPDATIVKDKDQVEPVPHVVQRGENFWTIARLYYGTGRYWKALWAANRAKVTAPDRLYVGTTIRIPPPEALDRALIEPPKTTGAPTPSSPPVPLRRTSRPVLDGDQAVSLGRNSVDEELVLPLDDSITKRGGERQTWNDLDPEPEARRYRPRRPVYKVRSYDTLRSIARDTLDDSRRADEILELNEEIIDNPRHLIPGQIIELPEDARIGRRER
jgi:nucleoid-associated protein YgaU